MLFFFFIGNSTVQPIDEPKPNKRLTEAGQDGTRCVPTCPEMSNHFLKETIMKTTSVATTLILTSALLAGTSFAQVQDRSDATAMRTSGGASAELKSETSTLTREAVMAEYFAAKKAGSLPAINEVANARPVQPAGEGARSRAEVRAEAVMSARMHTQEYGG